jgi:hypothetical protein
LIVSGKLIKTEDRQYTGLYYLKKAQAFCTKYCDNKLLLSNIQKCLEKQQTLHTPKKSFNTSSSGKMSETQFKVSSKHGRGDSKLSMDSFVRKQTVTNQEKSESAPKEPGNPNQFIIRKKKAEDVIRSNAASGSKKMKYEDIEELIKGKSKMRRHN